MASVHLLVLLHGMWGNTDHLAELERIATETHESSSVDGISLHILKAETIKHESTYDGIDWGGERVAKEVRDDHFKSRPLYQTHLLRSCKLWTTWPLMESESSVSLSLATALVA